MESMISKSAMSVVNGTDGYKEVHGYTLKILLIFGLN